MGEGINILDMNVVFTYTKNNIFLYVHSEVFISEMFIIQHPRLLENTVSTYYSSLYGISERRLGKCD